jgi:hypothetical protein
MSKEGPLVALSPHEAKYTVFLGFFNTSVRVLLQTEVRP